VFSQTVEYALRAVVQLAMMSDEAMTAEQIAGATAIPLSYLRKVLRRLSACGLIGSQRGGGGGMWLAVEPRDITLLDVVNAIEKIERIETCPLGLGESANLCPLHAELDRALGQIEESLARKSIADIVQAKRGGNACGFPANG